MPANKSFTAAGKMIAILYVGAFIHYLFEQKQ
jgi:hypothetical protein